VEGSEFSPKTLQIQGIGKDPNDFKGLWQYGDDNYGNLYGTIRSLDLYQPTTLNCTTTANISVHGESLHCEWGAISTLGWNVYNDSQNYVLNSTNAWWEGTNNDEIDDYFFGHGRNYKAALTDFTKIAGRIPLIPKYSLGTWWTRWYAWEDRGLRAVINSHKAYHLPMDVLVLDMNWH
jgi:alpha-glucosidase (family GH31 glycosyl hydrolase)